MLNEDTKTIVKDIHSSLLFLVIFSRTILLERNLNKRRKIDVIPMLAPIIMSWAKPRKNKIVLEGFILNFTINKYKTIEIIFGVTVSNKEKKLKDF